MTTAVEMAEAVRQGRDTSESLVAGCLERIAYRDREVQAWEYLDPEQALAQARARDAEIPRGPLHGVPVGIKDVFDTVDMPTAYGSPIYAGNQPAWDAACVAALRAAGAVILGKTVTTEFAAYRPGKTANPHNLNHTPGGSSSGSAAAVADGMVPLTLGTQTAGSVIRPASFCGVVGYKPTFGWISRAGLKPLAESLDTVGAFAGSVADVALVVSVMANRPELCDLQSLQRPPRIGVCRTHEWPLAEAATVHAFEDARTRLAGAGAELPEIVLPESFRGLFHAQERVMAYEAAQNFAFEMLAHTEKLSEKLRSVLDSGRECSPETRRADLAFAAECRAALPGLLAGLDALLVPSVVGEAPEGLHATGDPAFNRIWTLLHTPCVNVPASFGSQRLPVGVQLTGPPHADRTVLAVAQWVAGVLSQA
ncbi:MAG: amidase [Deferrisomatales bacterium]|nr:amidase [Deferrisomatales bacterium]